MRKKERIEHFRRISVPRPSDLIIDQIKTLVADGRLKPGDKLPSENLLAKQLEVGRSHVREALNKLEWHGIIKTFPQSGTYLESIGILSMEGILSNILKMERDDFESLLDTRQLLEIQSAGLAAEKSSQDEIDFLQRIHERFINNIHGGDRGIDEDIFFHLKIAEFAHSSFLSYFIALLTPEIIRLCTKTERIEDGRYSLVIDEHLAILEGIKSRKPELAREAMGRHMRRIRKNRLKEKERLLSE